MTVDPRAVPPVADEDPPRAEGRRRAGPLVVLAWGTGNGLLSVMLVGFGESEFPDLLYASASCLVGLFALAVFWSDIRHPSPLQRYHLSSRGAGAISGAIGCGFAGLAFFYGYWFVPLALPFLGYALAVSPRGRPQLPPEGR